MEGIHHLDVFLLQSASVIDGEPYWAAKRNPDLRFLPLALAEFIGDNFHNKLKLPESFKSGPTGPQTKWKVSELNFILLNCLVGNQDGCHLHVFTLLEWESELCAGVPKARCSTLKKFRGKYVQVNSL